jgi:predicted oxidoreductase
VHWVERGLYEPGNSVPRFHMVWGTGQELTTTLINCLQNHRNADRLTCRFRHHVTDLERSGGRISGVRGVDERTDEPFRVEAEHVVIAAGGICGDIDRLKQHWYPDWGEPPDTILNGSHRYADGDLHDEAAEHGANVTHLDKQWLYAASVEHPDPEGKPYDALSIVPPKSALWVNHRGERIGPPPLVSGYDKRDLVEQIGRQEKQYSWQVMNWEIATTELAISGSEYNDAMRNKKPISFLWRLLTGADAMVEDLIDRCPDVVAADTVDGLVREMNRLSDNEVDGNLLRGEIEHYDAHIERGATYHNDEQLRRIAHLRRYRGDRTRTCKAQKILDPNASSPPSPRRFRARAPCPPATRFTPASASSRPPSPPPRTPLPTATPCWRWAPASAS